MKKNILFLLFIAAPFLVIAQPFSNKDKMLIVTKVDSLLQKYMVKSTLTEPGVGKQSMKVIKEFKSLFSPDAKVFDDINAEYNDDGNGYPYKLSEKTLNEYFDGLIEQFPGGLIVNYLNMNVSYENIDNGLIKIAIGRHITGTRSSGKYILVNKDSLLFSIKVQPEKTVKISAVAVIGSNIQVTNDMDLDGVIDGTDNCKDEKGKVLLAGCPDKDDDGIPDKDDDCPDQPGTSTNKGCPPSTFAYQFVFSAAAGYMLNLNTIKTPTPSDLGYSTEFLDRKRTTVKVTNPGIKGSPINFSANIAYYFGRKKFSKNKGISLGVIFTKYEADYDISGTQLVYKFIDGSNPEGIRKIKTLNDFAERNRFTTINFPLQLRFKQKLGAKWAGEIGFGPSFSIIYTKTELIDNVIYIDEYMQYDTINYKPYYNPDAAPTFADVALIRQVILSKRGVTAESAQIQFDNINNATNFNAVYGKFIGPDLEEIKEVQNGKLQTGISINANADVFYHIRPKTAIKVGAAFIYSPGSLNINKNKSINGDAEGNPNNYNPILNSAAEKTYIAFGLNIGLIIGISTNKN